MHLGCMGACFDVGAYFMTSCHRSAVRFANAKTEKISKAEFERRGLAEEDTIRPPESDGSHKEFMVQLKGQDLLEVKLQVWTHGLTGRPSNSAKVEVHKLFDDFIKEHRQLTGRTRDHTGRFHGAEYNLISKITSMKSQPGRMVRDPTEVLELVFRSALNATHPGLKAPSGTTVAQWMEDGFGIRSEHGHTTLFPHKSDAFPTCE